MAIATSTEQRIFDRGVDEEEQLVHHHREQGVVTRREASKQGVSRLAVEGGGGGGSVVVRSSAEQEEDAVRGRRSGGGAVVEEGRTLMPPPHAWLAVEDTKTKHHHHDISDPEEEWLRLLRGGGSGAGSGSGDGRQKQRRSSFSVVHRERAAREAWLDRAWEMKRSWHARNGGAPVVAESSELSMTSAAPHHHAPGAVGVAMDMEEVRACRDLGLDLPSDCAVEMQCYGLSDGGSPAHSSSSGGADSPACAGFSSPGTCAALASYLRD
jgi:hypothetical protein